MQFVLVLAIVVALLIAENSPTEPIDAGAWRLALAVATVTAVGGFAAVGARLIVARLRSDRRHGNASRWFRRLRQVHAALWFAAVVFVCYGLAWGQLVRFNWHLDRVFLLDHVLILAPVVAPLVISWLAFYDVERALRLGPGSDDVSLASFPSRAKYAMTLSRFYLGAILVPVLGLLAVQDAVALLAPEAVKNESLVATVLMAMPLVVTIVVFPWLLRYVWETRPLTPGPLRERLERAAERAGFRMREILVWRTGGMVANAAVTGFLPGMRYVFLTDGLLAELSDEQIEAVFGHEVGHVRHRHLLLRMLAMALPVSLWVLMEELFPETLAMASAWLWEADLGCQLRLALGMLAIMAVHVFLVFGAYSRMLEGQADLFGCRTLSFDPSIRPVDTFVSALEKLAATGGIDRNTRSWQHASVAKRVAFLTRVECDPLYEESFQRRLRWLAGLLTSMVISPVAYRLLVG